MVATNHNNTHHDLWPMSIITVTYSIKIPSVLFFMKRCGVLQAYCVIMNVNRVAILANPHIFNKVCLTTHMIEHVSYSRDCGFSSTLGLRASDNVKSPVWFDDSPSARRCLKNNGPMWLQYFICIPMCHCLVRNFRFWPLLDVILHNQSWKPPRCKAKTSHQRIVCHRLILLAGLVLISYQLM